ncbi:hypothetical protein COO60DRAFT_1460076 [Scenedesmus sp. NREL 46B-D3]|nr:hypothetical protein COO60DRAFT_1460076 [Scenedesmus sp. NREL 46B-D3]
MKVYHGNHTSQGLTAPVQAIYKLPMHTPVRQQLQCSKKRCMRRSTTAAAKRGSSPDGDVWQQLSSMADKYITNTTGQQQRQAQQGRLPVQGIHVLLTAVTLGLSSWWSPLTDAFCSTSGQLLARNLFFGYMFGRVVENTESGGALWLTYLLGAAGGSTAACVLLPTRAPIQGCGSTGALFALFAMATLFNRRKTWHWQRVFELAVLLPFVCQQLLAGHAGMSQWCLLYGHRMGAWVPLLGGLAGAGAAAAVLALVRLLVSSVEQRQQQQRRQQAAAELAGGQQRPAGADDSMALLLTKALAQMLRRVL